MAKRRASENQIVEFKDEFDFLSNYHACSIMYMGLRFLSVEAAYQSLKCASEEDRIQFQLLTAPQAKKRGREVQLRPDWEDKKLQFMSDLVRIKFETHSDLRGKLIATGDSELIEGNWWHDNFWGDCTCAKCREIKGQNHLGLILMETRRSLQMR